MAHWISGRRGTLARLTDDLEERPGHAKFEEAEVRRVVAALVAAGLFAWALYTFGPELRRYLKIRSM